MKTTLELFGEFIASFARGEDPMIADFVDEAPGDGQDFIDLALAFIESAPVEPMVIAAVRDEAEIETVEDGKPGPVQKVRERAARIAERFSDAVEVFVAPVLALEVRGSEPGSPGELDREPVTANLDLRVWVDAAGSDVQAKVYLQGGSLLIWVFSDVSSTLLTAYVVDQDGRELEAEPVPAEADGIEFEFPWTSSTLPNEVFLARRR